jgi:putative aminopeptidase FrvX
MGKGVILRVGDKTSIFDSVAMRFLSKVASGLQTKIRGFQCQRALMGGGTCEATAYQEFGLQSAGICVALGNYHNCGSQNRIRAEYVSVADAVGMVQLLVAAAREMSRFEALTRELPTQLKRLGRAAEANLRRTASGPDA